MPKEKKQSRASIRFGPTLYKVATDLAARHDLELSEYIRGLVAADAAREGLSLAGVDLPGWIVGDRISVSHEDVRRKEEIDVKERPKAPAAKR